MTEHPEYGSFLAAVRTAPAAGRPLPVNADWLDEVGRAALVRA